MSNLVLIGLNHRTAELDIRQRMALAPEQIPENLKHLAELPEVHEVMILSTCNRVEVLADVEDSDRGQALIEDFLSRIGSLPRAMLEGKLYQMFDDQAVRHVFRVASSLDSMIIGEPQILGQMKASYGIAMETRTIGPNLSGVLQAAFRTAKRVRSETSIGEYSVSVSSAAVELARKIFDDLGSKSVLIVGAGKMGEVAVRHLASSGAGSIRVTNRSPQAAIELAERFRGTHVPFSELQRWVARSDIIITSTGSPEVLIDFPLAQAVMQERKNAPIVFIDISVPRNIDPSVGAIDNVFSYDIDDLGAVVEANRIERRKQSSSAEKIVEHEAEVFSVRRRSHYIAPVAIQLQEHIEGICRVELERYLNRAGPHGTKQLQELESMISRITGKIAHPLLANLRDSPQQSPKNEEAYVDLIRRLFKIQKDRE
jgi:glutamyl-tRNA reductase